MLSAAGFADQKPVEFDFFGYQLAAPSNHLLLRVLDPKSPAYEPYRESGLVKLARALQPRSGTAIDIGANIGDTCAILYRHTALKIICIDASDFFFPYLSQNIASHFSDRASARHAFVTAARNERAKSLYHWGGTARPTAGAPTENCETISVADLLASAGDIALLKVDVDGPDIELIAGVFRQLGAITSAPVRFPIYFEFEFVGKTPDDMRVHANRFIALSQTAAAAGYTSAFLWDAPGRFYGLLDLRQPRGLINAINYLGHSKHQSVWGYDICLIHQSDAVLAADLRSLVSSDVVMPLSAIW
jgi:FkbM family methyltransferase